MFARASMRIASTSRSVSSTAFMSGSFPGENRDVDGPRCPLPANGPDGVVHLRQSERMGRHKLEREAVRRQLMQGELHRPVGMATRALQRHAFPRQPPDRKGGKLLVAFALHD